MYIGPWQEFALGRALQQRPDRRTASLRARPDAADRAADDAFAVDLEFFKAFASQSDEEGIRNLLRCAPRFVPIMQSLGRASQTRTAPHTTPHTAAVATAEPPDATSVPQQRPWSATGPSRSAATAAAAAAAAAARRPKPAAAASVPAQRRRRMQQLQAMYRTAGEEGDEGDGSNRGIDSGGGGGSGGSSGAIGPASGASERPLLPSLLPPLPPLLPPLLLPPPSPSQRASLLPPCSPLRAGSRATVPAPSPSLLRPPASSPTPLSDEWEEEVDGLLEWTMGLADFEIE